MDVVPGKGTLQHSRGKGLNVVRILGLGFELQLGPTALHEAVLEACPHGSPGDCLQIITLSPELHAEARIAGPVRGRAVCATVVGSVMEK